MKESINSFLLGSCSFDIIERAYCNTKEMLECTQEMNGMPKRLWTSHFTTTHSSSIGEKIIVNKKVIIYKRYSIKAWKEEINKNKTPFPVGDMVI